MEYNSQRSPLVFREYGRNIQNLVEYAVTVEDDEKRNHMIAAIIELMGHLNPHLRNVDDFRHKLWDHLHILSDFQLKVESPYDPPSKEDLYRKPEHIGYPKHDARFRHYGKNVEHLVAKAIEMEDEEKKNGFAEVIANYMKMVYKNWNRENVSDELIKNDLETLSDGKLVLEEDANLDLLGKSTRKKSRRQGSDDNRGGKSGKRRNHKNSR